MRPLQVSIVLAGTVIMLTAGAAHAANCYVILDAREMVIYRDATPPVDMSDRGAAARETLRRKGDYLLFMDTERCAPAGFGSGWANTNTTALPGSASNKESITATDDGAVARAARIQPARSTNLTPAGRGMSPGAGSTSTPN